MCHANGARSVPFRSGYEWTDPAHVACRQPYVTAFPIRRLCAVDFAASDSLLTPANYATWPDLQMYPSMAAAVVSIYNVPELAAAGVTLVLSREALAGVYLGAITLWNDTAIATLNPGVALPGARIVVCVRLDKSGTTEILTRALTRISPAWAAAVGISPLPAWPAAAGVRKYAVTAGVAAAVYETPYSLGYAVLTEASSIGARVASMRNKAGNVVAPSIESVSYALMELGGAFDARFTADIADPASSFAWPIAGCVAAVTRKLTGARGHRGRARMRAMSVTRSKLLTD